MKIFKSGHNCPKIRNEKINKKAQVKEEEIQKPKKHIGKKILYALTGLSILGMVAVKLGQLEEDKNKNITPINGNNGSGSKKPSGGSFNTNPIPSTSLNTDKPQDIESDKPIDTEQITGVSQPEIKEEEKKDFEEIIKTINSPMEFPNTTTKPKKSEEIRESFHSLLIKADSTECTEDGIKIKEGNKSYIFDEDCNLLSQTTQNKQSEITEIFDKDTQELKTREIKEFYPNNMGVKSKTVIQYNGDNRYSEYIDDFRTTRKHMVKNASGGYETIYRGSNSGALVTDVHKFGNHSFKNVDNYAERSSEITVRNKKGDIEFHDKYFWDKKEVETEKVYEQWFLNYLKLCKKYNVTPRPCGVTGGAWSHYYELCLREYNPEGYQEYLRLEEYRARYDEKAALMLDLRNGNASMNEEGEVKVIFHDESSIERLKNKNNFFLNGGSESEKTYTEEEEEVVLFEEEEPIEYYQPARTREIQHVYA